MRRWLFAEALARFRLGLAKVAAADALPPQKGRGHRFHVAIQTYDVCKGEQLCTGGAQRYR